jgi:hypothetical protein
MFYGDARISTVGQSVAAQLLQLTSAGAMKVFRGPASGGKTNRARNNPQPVEYPCDDLYREFEHHLVARMAADISLEMGASATTGTT